MTTDDLYSCDHTILFSCCNRAIKYVNEICGSNMSYLEYSDSLVCSACNFLERLTSHGWYWFDLNNKMCKITNLISSSIYELDLRLTLEGY